MLQLTIFTANPKEWHNIKVSCFFSQTIRWCERKEAQLAVFEMGAKERRSSCWLLEKIILTKIKVVVWNIFYCTSMWGDDPIWLIFFNGGWKTTFYRFNDVFFPISKNPYSVMWKEFSSWTCVYGCFLKWWYPQNTPEIIIFSRKTHGCWVPPF